MAFVGGRADLWDLTFDPAARVDVEAHNSCVTTHPEVGAGDLGQGSAGRGRAAAGPPAVV
jgi:hypothetical protein